MSLDDLTKAYDAGAPETPPEEPADEKHIAEAHELGEGAEHTDDGHSRAPDTTHEAVTDNDAEKAVPENVSFSKLAEDWSGEEHQTLASERGNVPPVDALHQLAGAFGDRTVDFPDQHAPEALQAWIDQHMQHAPFGDHVSFHDALHQVIQYHFATRGTTASPQAEATASGPSAAESARAAGGGQPHQVDEPPPALDRINPRVGASASSKTDQSNVYRLEEVEIGRDKRTIPGPDDIPPQFAQGQPIPPAPPMMMRGGMGGGIPAGGAGAGLSNVLGSAIGGIFGFATTTTMAASRAMSQRIAEYLDRNNGPAPALVNPVERAESMIVEAELASNRVIKAAQTLREHPTMASFVEEFDALARPEGKLIPDVIRHMKPGGKQETLWDRFQTAMAGDSSFAEAHKSLAKELASHESAWAGATEAVAAAKGAPDQLWARFDRATSDVRAATQDLPGEPGKSFADMARGFVEKLQTAFARVFRLAPSRNGSSPSMSAS